MINLIVYNVDKNPAPSLSIMTSLYALFLSTTYSVNSYIKLSFLGTLFINFL